MAPAFVMAEEAPITYGAVNIITNAPSPIMLTIYDNALTLDFLKNKSQYRFETDEISHTKLKDGTVDLRYFQNIDVASENGFVTMMYNHDDTVLITVWNDGLKQMTLKWILLDFDDETFDKIIPELKTNENI